MEASVLPTHPAKMQVREDVVIVGTAGVPQLLPTAQEPSISFIDQNYTWDLLHKANMYN